MPRTTWLRLLIRPPTKWKIHEMSRRRGWSISRMIEYLIESEYRRHEQAEEIRQEQGTRQGNRTTKRG